MEANRELSANGRAHGVRPAKKLDIPAAARDEILKLERALLREQVDLHRFNTEVFKAKALTLQTEIQIRDLSARINERASAVARQLNLDDDAVIDFVACEVVHDGVELLSAARDREQPGRRS